MEYRTGEIELYDLRTDPFQLMDLSDDAGSSDVRADLAARLDALCDPPPPDAAPLGATVGASRRPVAWLAIAALLGTALFLLTRRVAPPRADGGP